MRRRLGLPSTLIPRRPKSRRCTAVVCTLMAKSTQHYGSSFLLCSVSSASCVSIIIVFVWFRFRDSCPLVSLFFFPFSFLVFPLSLRVGSRWQRYGRQYRQNIVRRWQRVAKVSCCMRNPSQLLHLVLSVGCLDFWLCWMLVTVFINSLILFYQVNRFFSLPMFFKVTSFSSLRILFASCLESCSLTRVTFRL